MAPIATRRRPAAGSQAALTLLQPHAAQKNPHVCVLNLAGSGSGHRTFTNPQVNGLQGFRLLPPAELKRKRTSFLRASRTKGARNSPSQVRMPAPGATLPSARSIRPTMPQAPAAPSPPHSQAPATSSPSRPSACRPWPQCPRHLRIPYRRTSVTHRLPHNARPCTRGFPRSCVRCNLVPHGFQPTAPTGAACQTRRPSPLRFPRAARRALVTSSVRPCRAARCTGTRKPRGRAHRPRIQ